MATDVDVRDNENMRKQLISRFIVGTSRLDFQIFEWEDFTRLTMLLVGFRLCLNKASETRVYVESRSGFAAHSAVRLAIPGRAS
jgi:hypothetical protein